MGFGAEKICAILLGAGSGSRFRASANGDPALDGVHKLTAVLRGRPVYEWALDSVLDAGFDDIVVVTGAAELRLPSNVRNVHNPRYADGQATSLQCGLAVAADLLADAVVVGLADQPFVMAESWRSVAAAESPIAVATYDGRRGNPVLLKRVVWPLLPREGDHGARSLFLQRPELVTEVPCSGSAADIDTMEDLQQWNSSTNSPSIVPSMKRGRS
jgi:CTP:molybdopterin cytidylyltransferase MocA